MTSEHFKLDPPWTAKWQNSFSRYEVKVIEYWDVPEEEAYPGWRGRMVKCQFIWCGDGRWIGTPLVCELKELYDIQKPRIRLDAAVSKLSGGAMVDGELR